MSFFPIRPFLCQTLFVLVASITLASAPTRADEEEEREPCAVQTSETSALGSAARKGVWQGGSASAEFSPRTDGFGQTLVGANAKLGLPSPIKGHFLLLSPSVDWRDVELPSRNELGRSDLSLLSVGGSIGYVVPKSKNLLYNVSVGLNWSSDCKANDSEALRLSGVGTAVWTASDEWKWLFGAAYVDSSSWRVLPVVGAFWTPSEDWRVDLMFPQPKISRRLNFLPATEDSSYWAYFGGGLSGFTSVFEPRAKSSDAAKVKYNDWRVMTGFEKKAPTGFGYSLETGTIFSRKYEFEALDGNYWQETKRPGATLYLKSKATF